MQAIERRPGLWRINQDQQVFRAQGRCVDRKD